MIEKVLQLDAETLNGIVEKKATCPFIATAVATGSLPVRNEAANPLASIGELKRLGDSGGGDLGDVLVFFATGNHGFMRSPDGRLDQQTPLGLFSLEFPGSQGSHPGHSGILQGDPEQLDSGRLSLFDFERLASRATGGFLKRSDVAKFIAGNLRRDPNSKVSGTAVAALLLHDAEQLAAATVRGFAEKLLGLSSDHRELVRKLTKLMGEDNLVGSSGEFGLLFAFFAHKPGAKELDGEPALAVQDLRSMFVDKRFPQGWETWEKRGEDWLVNTLELAAGAARNLGVAE